MMQTLVVALIVPLVAGFTVQRPALLHPPRSASLVILNDIDIDKVTSSISLPGGPSTAPAPAKKEEPAPPVKVEEASPAPAPTPEVEPNEVAPVVAPPSAPPSGDVALPDLPLPVIGGGFLAAIAAGTFAMRGGKEEREKAQSASPAPVDTEPAPASAAEPAPSSPSATDLSIPYDAAARLAYDEWRAKYGKGEFDASKYETFKVNYEANAVANVVAKKKASEDGTEATEVELDESADQ